MLRQRGFEIFNILPGNQLTKIRKIAPPVSDDLSRTNYIAVPKCDVDELLRVFASQQRKAHPELTLRMLRKSSDADSRRVENDETQ